MSSEIILSVGFSDGNTVECSVRCSLCCTVGCSVSY